MIQCTCVRCSVDFVSKSHGPVKYCSSSCRAADRKDKTAAAREAARLAVIEAGEKECARCGVSCPLSDFRKDARRADGLFPYCIRCWREYTGAEAFKRAELSRSEYMRRRHAARMSDPQVAEQVKKDFRDSHLVRSFNITSDEYKLMLAEQGGRCAICRRTPEEVGDKQNGAIREFAVDHDHGCCPSRGKSCGRCIRGLLCRPCNTAIGLLSDDGDRISRAARYVCDRGTSYARSRRWEKSA